MMSYNMQQVFTRDIYPAFVQLLLVRENGLQLERWHLRHKLKYNTVEMSVSHIG